MSPGRGSHQLYSEAFPADAAAVRGVRDAVAAIARDCGLDERDLHGIRLGVSEVVTNAVVHGYGQDGRDADDGEIRAEVFYERGEMLVVIADDGLGMAPRVGSPGLGLGLPIVASVAERFEVISPAEGGTEVHLVFPCPDGDRITCA